MVLFLYFCFIFRRTQQFDRENPQLEDAYLPSELLNLNRNDLDEEKVGTIDRKLKAIENRIIADTIKYTGAHDGEYGAYEIDNIDIQFLLSTSRFSHPRRH